MAAQKNRADSNASDRPSSLNRQDGRLLYEETLKWAGFKSESEANAFLNPSREAFLSPQLIPGIAEATQLIQHHLNANNHLILHGDYDVDGVSSTAILYLALQKLGASVETVFPNRYGDGYGISNKFLDSLSERNASLVITLDCGVNAFEEIKRMRAQGLAVIVIDHHRISEEGVPDANVFVHEGFCLNDNVVNAEPCEAGSSREAMGFATAGLAYKLAQSLIGKDAERLLGLAALGTLADMVPLRRDNRLLVRFGFEQMKTRKDIPEGLLSLMQTAGIRDYIEYGDLARKMAPIINAAGRMGQTRIAFNLLVQETKEACQIQATELNKLNKKRRSEEQKVMRSAEKQIQDCIDLTQAKSLVLWGEWHPGVISIVAGRLSRKHELPTAIIAMKDGLGRGSFRSANKVDGYCLLSELQSILVRFGGHAAACGFDVEEPYLEELRSKMNQVIAAGPITGSAKLQQAKPVIELESLREITEELLGHLYKMRPFGIGNPEPCFKIKKLAFKTAPESRGWGQCRAWVTDGESVLEASWMKDARYEACLDRNFESTFHVKSSRFLGEIQPQLFLLDAS